MSKIRKIIGVGVLVAVVIAIGVHYPKVSQPVQQVLGAIPGADLLFPQINFNGVKKEDTRKALTLATTTPCAIKSPSATSTIASASLMVTTASSTATTWTVARATTAFATTTPLTTAFSLSSAVQGSMTYFASSTVPTIDSTSVVAPNTYLVWGVAGVAPAGTGLGGVCSAEFVLL